MMPHSDREHPPNRQPHTFMTKDSNLTMASMAARASARASGTPDFNLPDTSTMDMQPRRDLSAKLSAELQNAVLELVVVPDHIEISRKGTYVNCCPEDSTANNSKKLMHHIRARQAHPIFEDNLVGLSLAKLGQRFSTGILRVNRTIGGTALQMLYGSNEFHFTDEKAFLLFCDIGPSARTLTTRLKIRVANIKRLDLCYLSGNSIIKSLELTLTRHGNTGAATIAEIWSAISGHVVIGDFQQQKRRFDLIKFEIKGRSMISWGRTYPPGLNDVDHGSLKQDLLFAWGSELSSRRQSRCPFMPEEINWML